MAATGAETAGITVVCVALIDTDGRVLLAERPAGKPLAGLWEFPGGKIDASERPEDALIRELGEELGIEVKAACLGPCARTRAFFKISTWEKTGMISST